MTSTHTSVAITREASSALDVVSKRTGMTKQVLASRAILLFFDPELNPNLAEALEHFTTERESVEKSFTDRMVAFVRSEKTRD
jgi:hypothetical protein